MTKVYTIKNVKGEYYYDIDYLDNTIIWTKNFYDAETYEAKQDAIDALNNLDVNHKLYFAVEIVKIYVP